MKLTKDVAFAILSEERACAVKLNPGKGTGTKIIRTVPTNWHPDVLRWVLDRFSRIASEKLNEVPLDGGEKARAFEAVMAIVNAGDMPDVLVGSNRGSRVDDRESIIAELWIAQTQNAIRPLMVAAGFGSGKRGNASIVAADYPAFVAVSKDLEDLRPFIRAAGDGYVWDTLAIVSDDRVVDAWGETADAELEARAKKAAEEKAAAESPNAKAIVAGLFAKPGA